MRVGRGSAWVTWRRTFWRTKAVLLRAQKAALEKLATMEPREERWLCLSCDPSYILPISGPASTWGFL